jgi:hypothetical protein
MVNFGFGRCREELDNGHQCAQPAVSASGRCYYDDKLSRNLLRRWQPESVTTLTRRKAARR